MGYYSHEYEISNIQSEKTVLSSSFSVMPVTPISDPVFQVNRVDEGYKFLLDIDSPLEEDELKAELIKELKLIIQHLED
jgi:hypothetical protein